MTKTREWFGDSFNQLAPLLQDLHLHGGSLLGPVDVWFVSGPGGLLGKRLAKKLGVPLTSGRHELRVDISHHDDGLHWDRCFDNSTIMRSIFTPIGDKNNGYWIENTGPVKLFLTVEIKNAGWYWRNLKVRFKNITIPKWLLPKTHAYKLIEDNAYRFYVGISLPLFGQVLSYSGLLHKVA